MNQLSEKHNFSSKKTYALIKQIKEVSDNAFEIIIKDIGTEKKATIILNEAFFSNSSDVGLSDYIRMIRDYISKEDSKELITLVVFELREFNEGNIVLYINNESAIKIVINDGISKLKQLNLSQFAVLYSTKVI